MILDQQNILTRVLIYISNNGWLVITEMTSDENEPVTRSVGQETGVKGEDFKESLGTVGEQSAPQKNICPGVLTSQLSLGILTLVMASNYEMESWLCDLFQQDLATAVS